MKERRKYQRFSILSDVILYPLRKIKRRHKIHCIGYDLSQGGVAIISDKILRLQNSYIIKFKGVPYTMSGFLVSEHVLDLMPRITKYGLEFHAPMKLVQLEVLLREIGSTNEFDHVHTMPHHSIGSGRQSCVF